MEWYDIIKDLVSTLGFPIACSIYLFYQNSKLVECIGDLKTAIIELKEKFDSIK